jgi:hypothetical protein
MVNTYSPAAARHSAPADFAVSFHGTLTFIEAQTTEAKQFLTACRLPSRTALTYPEFREVRYAARHAGLSV